MLLSSRMVMWYIRNGATVKEDQIEKMRFRAAAKHSYFLPVSQLIRYAPCRSKAKIKSN